MVKLEFINLIDSHVIDITPLKELKILKLLFLGSPVLNHTRAFVSVRQILELQKALPKCKISNRGEMDNYWGNVEFEAK